MNLLLPQLYQLEVRLLPDPAEQSVLLQKEGLKVYFALTQYILPLDLISKEAFAQWMEVCRQVRNFRIIQCQNVKIEQCTTGCKNVILMSSG